MPCFFTRLKIKRLLDVLNIKNIKKLNRELLKRYSDSELHAMSDNELIFIIKKIYKESKKELQEDAILMYA